MPHILLIAKLNACGSCLKALKLMNNSQGKVRTKPNGLYSSLEQIFFAESQGLFYDLVINTFLSDLSLILNDIDFTSYADDSTCSYQNFENVI